jgi:hypothetical protein
MKGWVSIAVLVVLVIDVALFFGIGFGTGGLAVASNPPNYTQNCWGSSSGGNPATGTAGAMDFCVNIVGEPGTSPITSMLAGGSSTQIVFNLQLSTTDNCGGGSDPAWAPGQGANYGYYVVQYLVDGAPVAMTGTLNGGGFQATTLTIPENSTSILAWCWLVDGSNSISQTLTNGQPVMQNTVVLQGLYAVGTISVSFFGQGTFCNGNTAATNVCATIANAGPGFQQPDSPNGNFIAKPVTTAAVYSGQASFTPTSYALYNGGTLAVSVTTGYDGAAAYTLQVDCPQARSCAGQPDTTFGTNPVTVANDCNGCIISWKIPTNAAVNTSAGAAYNTWVIVLKASYINQQLTPVPIVISPLYQPGTPSISFADKSGLVLPPIGDTVTITVTASPAQHSTNVTGISIWVVYLGTGQAPGQWPSCGSQWVTTGCPGGQAIVAPNLVLNGGSATGTYTFTVAPPTGFNEIGIEAISSTVTGQPSQPAFDLISIAPVTCQPGSPACPTMGQQSLWSIAGPILFSAAFVLAALLGMLYVPIGMAVKVAVPVLVAGGFVALYYFGILGSWFVPGGVL